MRPSIVIVFALSIIGGAASAAAKPRLVLNERDYFSMPGLDVMAFQDFYPEGHQGAVSIIQNGVRVASNGDLRLEPAPGQWAPVPVQKARVVDRKAGEIITTLAYPDPDKDHKGFNPIDYPKLSFTYRVRVHAEGASVRVLVDLDQPLPSEWIGKVGFNLELYPAALFGRTFYSDSPLPAPRGAGRGEGSASGLFSRQPNGPVAASPSASSSLSPPGGERVGVRGPPEVTPEPLGSGHRLVIAPETPAQRLTIESHATPLQLLDGRINHPNGWFIVRSTIPAGATTAAIDWLITPNAIPNWRAPPVVHVSQVGYHPSQRKVAVIEVDAADRAPRRATLVRIGEDGRREPVLAATAKPWTGTFLRYRYHHFDFSKVTREGIYQIELEPSEGFQPSRDALGRAKPALARRDLETPGAARTEPFRIARDVWKRQVWQPTLGVFLPVQMCHMRVTEKYKVWHGACHLDDARMAPTNYNHFDGYKQGDKTLTNWLPGKTVPGLDVGGWHDAGDDDLRIESQAGEVYVLSLAYETFGVRDDDTTIDEAHRSVEIRQPDGKPDMLQQIAHGMLHVVGAWKALGRFPRGMIVPTLPQYRMVGDVANQTDNVVCRAPAACDDRLVFTEVNPARALVAAANVAAGARVLRGFDDGLARDGLRAAEAVWKAEEGAGRAEGASEKEVAARVHAATELFLTTRKEEYRRAVIEAAPGIRKQVAALGWVVGRALPTINDAAFTAAVREAVAAYAQEERAAAAKNPFAVPYEPVIWGAGWGIQEHGVRMYFLHAAFPDLVGADAALDALNFVLGVHPGTNTASFASGIGARSMTTAYGWNRADWSYIPGGVVSGTALIRPDFAEMKDFPFLWQQGEYVLGGGATNFMFLAVAADRMASESPVLGSPQNFH